MIEKWKQNPVYIHRFEIIIAAGFTGFYASRFFRTFEETVRLDLFFVYAFGSLDIRAANHLIAVVLWMLPELLLIYVLGSSLYHAFQQNAVYIFTRTKKRSLWLGKHCIRLLGNVCIYYLFYIATTLLTVLMFVRSYSFTIGDFSIIIIIFFLKVLSGGLLVLFTNLLSFFVKETFACILVIFIDIFLLFLSGLIHQYFTNMIGLIKWFPSVQSILTWHMFFPVQEWGLSVFSFTLEEWTLTFSFIYLVTCYMIVLIFFIRFVRKMDIL